MKKGSTHLTLGLGAVLVLGFLAQGGYFLGANSQTFDEAVHLAAGYSTLSTGDFRLNPEHPPFLKELAALPVFLWYRVPFRPDPRLWDQAEKWMISRDFLYNSPVAADEMLTLARLPGLGLGALLVALTGWWAYRLWGRGAALVALTLTAFEPNLIAHASLVTTDVGSGLFMTTTLYALWEYGIRRSPVWLGLAGLALGLALASKFSTVLLVGTIGLLLGLHLLWPRAVFRPSAEGAPPRITTRVKDAVLISLILGIVGLFAVLAAYHFQGVSRWITGLGWQVTKGGFGHPGYFLGQHSTEGWRLYFPVAFLMKTPIGSLALVALAFLTLRRGRPLTGRDFLFLILPVAVFVAVVVRGRINIGLRYIVPLYPLLYLCTARLATLPVLGRGPGCLIVIVPLLMTAGSSLRQAPHHLAYFNEAVGGPEAGPRYLSDSNIDWGQDLKTLRTFMEREGLSSVYLSYFGTALPEGYGVRAQEIPACSSVQWPLRPIDPLPAELSPQLLVISVTCLQGTYFEDKESYSWLNSRKPKARLGYSLLVYDISDDADAHRHLADLYQHHGRPEWALEERRHADRLAGKP